MFLATKNNKSQVTLLQLKQFKQDQNKENKLDVQSLSPKKKGKKKAYKTLILHIKRRIMQQMRL